MMKAVVVSALSDDFSGMALSEASRPVPQGGQVAIAVRAASLNFPDMLMTRGLYQLKPELPFIPGMEFAGDIVVADPETGFAPGEAVVGSARFGGMAEFVVADASYVHRMPTNLTYVEAAAIGAAYVTAYVSLVRRAVLGPNEWLLVQGASGGVGMAAVDLGRVLGARVIAASSSPEKLAVIAEKYGPVATISSAPGFREVVNDLTGGGADVIFDPVGGDVFDESCRCIAFDGRLLVVGFASGRIPTISASKPLIKGFSVIGVRAGEYGRRFPGRGRENLDIIWRMAAEGKLRPHICAELPFDRWRDAFDMMDRRQLVGKIVLLP